MRLGKCIYNVRRKERNARKEKEKNRCEVTKTSWSKSRETRRMHYRLEEWGWGEGKKDKRTNVAWKQRGEGDNEGKVKRTKGRKKRADRGEGEIKWRNNQIKTNALRRPRKGNWKESDEVRKLKALTDSHEDEKREGKSDKLERYEVLKEEKVKECITRFEEWERGEWEEAERKRRPGKGNRKWRNSRSESLR